jgi:hypothetical protein
MPVQRPLGQTKASHQSSMHFELGRSCQKGPRVASFETGDPPINGRPPEGNPLREDARESGQGSRGGCSDTSRAEPTARRPIHRAIATGSNVVLTEPAMLVHGCVPAGSRLYESVFPSGTLG